MTSLLHCIIVTIYSRVTALEFGQVVKKKKSFHDISSFLRELFSTSVWSDASMSKIYRVAVINSFLKKKDEVEEIIGFLKIDTFSNS